MLKLEQLARSKGCPINKSWVGLWLMLLCLSCTPHVPEKETEVDSEVYNEQVVDDYLEMLLDSEQTRMTGFTEAARWGRYEIVEELLADGVDPNAPDEFGRTALLLAATGGELEVISLLLDHGADVNFQLPDSGKTPLIALLSSFHSETTYYAGAHLLIEAGANIDRTDQLGRTAFDWLRIRIQDERSSQEIIEALQSAFDNRAEPVRIGE